MARNRGITARYARWYLEAPALFKWSGLAVSASLGVGRYLGARDRLALRWARGSIELLRRTNNAVFADVGWAHAAFLAEDGGIGAVEAGLAARPSHARLLEGFQDLERGRTSPRGKRASDWVWRGTAAILEFEQRLHVQPQLGALPQPFRALFSLAATVDFTAFGTEAPRNRFALDAFGRGGNGLPDIGDFEQRWYWIERHVLPAYRAAEGRSTTMERHLRELAVSDR